VESDAERARAVFEALDGAFTGDGIVVAVAAVDSRGGGPAFAVTEGLPEDARFEIGSITKTMTATLLASLVGDGVLALDDEIGRWLDAGPHGGITLEQLATHTSGLPRLAPNQPTDEVNPYRDFTAERAQEGLRAAVRTAGAGHVYSNFGYQLLGLVLERASGQRYQDLLAQRLLGPLGMTRSGVGGAGGGTRVTGHAGGEPVGHWDFALPGPGAVEATIGDLGRYLAACLRPPDDPLGSAIRLCQQPRVRLGGAAAAGLAWIITDGLLFHNGGTGGFTASMTIDQDAGHAVAALVNTHGSSAPLLDAVVMAAVKGSDPLLVRPRDNGETAGPEWDERASTLARALIDGDYASVRRMLPPDDQSKLTAERLGQLWQFALDRIGDPGPVAVSCRSQPDGVAALITFAGRDDSLSLLVGYTPSGQIAMLRVIAPDEALPW
jgi:CubicO group peptidase (beta-lactamase class C family)